MKQIKISLIGIFAFLLTFNAFGQGWENFYSPNVQIDSFYISVTQNNNDEFFVLPKYHPSVLEVDASGNSNWFDLNDNDDPNLGGINSHLHDEILHLGNNEFFTATDYDFFNSKLSFAKFDANGDTIWTRKITDLTNYGGQYSRLQKVIETQDNKVIVLTANGINNNICIFKINPNNGSIIWHKVIPVFLTPDYYNKNEADIKEHSDGTFSISCRELSGFNIMLFKIDVNGNNISNQAYGTGLRPTSIDIDLNDNRLITGDEYLSNIRKPFIQLIDNIGNASINFNPWSQGSGKDAKYTPDGNILVIGETNMHWQSPYERKGVISKYDTQGNEIWTRYVGGDSTQAGYFFELSHIRFTSTGDYMVFGIERNSNAQKIFVTKIGSNGLIYENAIEGNVYKDDNLDCSLTTGENVLQIPVLIQIVQGTDTTFGITDNSGYYYLDIDVGTYELTALPVGTNWNSCPPQTLTVNAGDTITADLGLQPLIACSDLKVNITTPNLLRCFSNTYHVNYSNVGTQNETNAYVEIEFDPFLIINSASIPYTSVGNLYTFPVGNLNINQSGQFTVDVTVDCNSVLGQMHCVDATIYPNQICLPGAANWQGATIIADAFCDTGDSVKLRLENIGAGDMTQSRNYYVIEDQILPYQGSYYLLAGQDTTIALAANGYSYQVQADQEITHPWGNNVPSAVTFGCNLTDSTITVNGLINQFNLDDYLNFVDVDCQQNVGSYDPNDKQGFPLGYGTNNSISKNSEIEYMIRFQNTGTFTASNVRVEDEIDITTLDLSTLEMQSSSHAYVLSIEDGNKLVFNFNNIMLPDSNANEPASHGFVRFRIGQKANNPIGTMIANDAAIYFDFNAPIITNTTLHMIDSNFIPIGNPPVVTPTCAANFTINPINIPNPTWQLTAAATGIAPFTYQWTFNNLIVFQTSNISTLYTFPLNDSTEVCLTVTDATGCVSTVCQIYMPQSAPTCTATFTYTEQDGTVDFTTFTNSSFLVYNWNFGDGNIGSGLDPTHYYTTSGTYYVCVTASNMLGCSDTYCDSVIVVLPVSNNCLADFSYQIIDTNMVQFTNLSSGGIGQSSFVWNFGNGDTSSATNPQYTYDTTGQFVVTLTVTDSLGCISSFSDTISITTNTSRIEVIENLQISPNPVTDLLQLQLDLTAGTAVNISIVNMTGQLIKQHQENLTDGNHRIFLPTNDLPVGMYILYIQTENGSKAKRFIKQ